jgi:hypothetical protein
VPSIDPLRYRAHADAIVEQAARQFRELLRELAAGIDPFPAFPGSYFSYGIEVEPPAGTSEARGCVVLGEDGGLYELQVGLDTDRVTADDPAETRSEVRLPLDDLSPAEYVAYAHNAVLAALAHVEDGSD